MPAVEMNLNNVTGRVSAPPHPPALSKFHVQHSPSLPHRVKNRLTILFSLFWETFTDHGYL